jgi:CRP/FNR family transcriptional regulator, cyclic AMP receptor protein
MEDLERVLREHPFCAGLVPEHLGLVISCARNLRFRAGEFLLREGQCEDHLYLIRRGRVGLELQRPGAEPVCLETLGPGDVLGVSCLMPHKANLDCRAIDSVVAIELNNACLLGKMNEDPRLGYAITMRLLDLTYQRLSRHRLQLLDVYK